MRGFESHPRLQSIYQQRLRLGVEAQNFCCSCFRARWSDDVHEEWISNLLKRRPDLTRAQLERTRQLMDKLALSSRKIRRTFPPRRWRSSRSKRRLQTNSFSS